MENRFTRLAGLAGLGFLVTVIAEQVLRGQPLGNDSDAAAIARYYADRRVPLAITHGLFVLSLPLLLVYVTGMFDRLRAVAPAAPWARIARTAAATMAATFGAVVLFDIATAVTASASELDLGAVALLFRLHAAAFLLNTAVLGIALGAFGIAAWVAGTEPRWVAALAMLGGVLLIASAVPGVAVVEGSPWGLLGLAGFVCWLAWVAVSSVGLLRAGRRSPR